MKSKIALILTGVICACSAVFYAFAGNEKIKEEQMKNKGLEVATFAGGCFWCVESDFEKVNGVKQVVSGYCGGEELNPSYEQVASGGTGHTEAVQVYYDPGIVSYDQLLDVFWRHINPTDAGGQFVDRGSQYRSEIFYHNEQQKQKALASRDRLEKSQIFDSPIVTAVTRFEAFYKAESYHQDYYKKNKLQYTYYRYGSGRDQFLAKKWKNRDNNALAWSKPDDDKIRQMLTPLQYKVTQEDGTEPPFENLYWDNKAEGIYVDIVSGEPLFSSKDKFKSGTGWPSFTRPLEPDHIVEKKDNSLFMTRTEVRSRYGDSHLGHVFDDGPAPTGLRYCINSASLRFIPKEELEVAGYKKYAIMF